MTVVDSRTHRRGATSVRASQLEVVEPGLSRAATLRLGIGVVLLGAIGSVIADQKGGETLKLTFIGACVVMPLLGRPSALRSLLKALPITWFVAVALTEGGVLAQTASTTPGLKDLAIEAGQSLVLWAPWLWIGWCGALALTFARGGLRRRS